MMMNSAIENLIADYKKHIQKHRLEDEIYKWELVQQYRGRPDTDAEDFEKEIKSINFSNLVYAMGIAVAHHLAKERPEQLRQAFKRLYDESTPLQDRIAGFREETLTLYRELEKKLPHHQDERTIATYLTYHNPDKYTFYKDSFYRAYCKLLGVKHKSPGKKYVHYLELVQDLAYNYISKDSELIDMVREYLPENYDGANHLLLAQDMLYQMLSKKYAINKDAKWYMLARTAQAIGREEDLNKFFDIIKHICETYELSNDNELVYASSLGKRIHLTVGSRYVSMIERKNNKAQLGAYVDMQEVDSLREKYADLTVSEKVVDHEKEIAWVTVPAAEVDVEDFVEPAAAVVEQSINFQSKSQYRSIYKEKFNPFVLEAAVDPELRTQLFSKLRYYLVGAYWDDKSPEDQTDRFVSEGIWQNGYDDKFVQEVKSVPVGSLIAIKSTYTKAKTTSVMKIKAIGIVRTNKNDGKTLEVDWEDDFQPFEVNFTGGYWNTIVEVTNEDHIKEIWYGSTGGDIDGPTEEIPPIIYPKYSLSDLDKEVFVERSKLESILQLLEYKKNIILQGPPGTGKTFIARRLAYAHLGAKNSGLVKTIQFHQSYAYEDFIQGYRPTSAGGFALKNGVFYEFCVQAQKDPENDYFFIIDEINRGNLSKIFGELMMLIEHDKRGPSFAIPLTYSNPGDAEFYIPSNVYIIGTMNTADRSLAIVDYALRRRFSFVDIVPEFNGKFQQYLRDRQVPVALVTDILAKLRSLNENIEKDNDLGWGYKIGHSYFCNVTGQADTAWYNMIIENEIRPLLKEYWFDNTEKADNLVDSLRI